MSRKRKQLFFLTALLACLAVSAALLAFASSRQRFVVEVVVCKGGEELMEWFETMDSCGTTIRNDARFKPVALGTETDYGRLRALEYDGKVQFVAFEPFEFFWRKEISQRSAFRNGWIEKSILKTFENLDYDVDAAVRIQVRMLSHTTTNCLLKFRNAWNYRYSAKDKHMKPTSGLQSVAGGFKNTFKIAVPYWKWVFARTDIETPREIYSQVVGLRIKMAEADPLGGIYRRADLYFDIANDYYKGDSSAFQRLAAAPLADATETIQKYVLWFADQGRDDAAAHNLVLMWANALSIRCANSCPGPHMTESEIHKILSSSVMNVLSNDHRELFDSIGSMLDDQQKMLLRAKATEGVK